MLPHALLEELHTLDRESKLKVIQVLVDDLAAGEEQSLAKDAPYEIFTPYGNEVAAELLYEALQEHNAAGNTDATLWRAFPCPLAACAHNQPEYIW